MSDGITELERLAVDEVLDAIGGPLTPREFAAVIATVHRFTALALEMGEQIQRLEERCFQLRMFI